MAATKQDYGPTGFSQKPLNDIVQDMNKYRVLSHKWFTDTESGDNYQLIYFAHDDNGALCVVLNHVGISQIKRVIRLDKFFEAWEPQDAAYKRFMTVGEVNHATTS